MKLRWLVLIAVLFVPMLNAQEEEPAQVEGKTEGDLVRERFNGIGDVIDSVTIEDSDVDAFVEHYASFKKAMADDEKYAGVKSENWKKGFDHAVDTEAFDEWQTAAGIDGRVWLRKSFRIQVFYLHEQMTESIESGRKAVSDNREHIEVAKDLLPDREYEESLQRLEDTEATLDDLEKAAESLPEPTQSESTVMENRREDIEKALSE